MAFTRGQDHPETHSSFSHSDGLSNAHMATGSYTGDGTTSQQISGIGAGLRVRHIEIIRRAVVAADFDAQFYVLTNTSIIDNNANGMCVSHENGVGVMSYDLDRIISLDTDSFTIDDRALDENPNSNGVVYDFTLWGVTLT